MRLIDELSVGDQFRVAHPDQWSRNSRPMPREVTFTVDKVYQQSPHYYLASAAQFTGTFSLSPETPVLYPAEANPTILEVEEFLDAGPKSKVVGYRLLWDGLTPLSTMTHRTASVLKMLKALNRVEFTPKEASELCGRNLEKFYQGKVGMNYTAVFSSVAKELVARGLVDEILDRSKVRKNMEKAGLE